MSNIAVVGGGAWGTALAMQAARAGHQVTLWARRAELIQARRESPRLPGVILPDSVQVTDRLPTGGVRAILMAVPMAHLRTVLEQFVPSAPTVLCAKGLEPATRLLPGELLEAMYPATPSAVLSGPNFAAEIAAGLPAAAVIAAHDAGLRSMLIRILATPGFRIYGNEDPIGVQWAGVTKNVMAIAAGAVIGAGLGENARAALITRGVAELARLLVALGGRTETAFGLAGLGDLLLTCTGPASRNYQLGWALGGGASVAEALAGRSGATEGADSAVALVARAGDVDLPICRAVATLLSGRKNLQETIQAILARPLKDE